MAKPLPNLSDAEFTDLVEKTGSAQVAKLCRVPETQVLARMADLERKHQRATAAKMEAVRKRPYPPGQLVDGGTGLFVPASELNAWVMSNVIGDGPLYNEDFDHLLDAKIGWLWTDVELTKGGKLIVGQCQLPKIQGNKWAQARFAQQLLEWFDEEIDFLITLYAPYAGNADDLSFCGTVDHEIYHAGQAVDKLGCPSFNRATGLPNWTVVGHDVEEHLGVVRRYGVGGCAGESAEFVRLAGLEPEIGVARISAACGTCLRV